jgi:hypothetical protein
MGFNSVFKGLMSDISQGHETWDWQFPIGMSQQPGNDVTMYTVRH